ncbi:MAG: hypothetical protein IPK72_09590 [Candidatus Eisenbacteria bacterium]|nr:hypothetical protein [Candidatus Eisenbacteria bacterium]
MSTPIRFVSIGRRQTVLGLGLVLALASFGLVTSGLANKGDRIKPAHAKHAENGVPCQACHGSALTSKSGTDNLMPAMEVCAECHDVASEEHCGDCHTNLEAPGIGARHAVRVQNFSHELHAKSESDCASCHGSAHEPEIPGMAVCRDCHATASAMNDCRTCHAADEPLRPMSHMPDWAATHGGEALVPDADCADCHTQTDCQDCHAGDNVRPRVHPLGFDSSHALEARANAIDCAGCHEDVSFCSSCHTERQVLPRDHSSADWLKKLGGGRHAEEGRFDVESCIACHDAGTAPATCSECHQEVGR